jgi:hypothetical protein
MGVVLLSCITPNEITKARATFCCSPLRRVGGAGRSPAEERLGGLLRYYGRAHEYFGYAGTSYFAVCLSRIIMSSLVTATL